MMMQNQTKGLAAADEFASAGLKALSAQLGDSEPVLHLGAAARLVDLQEISSAPLLESFLIAYRDRILIPTELPAILSAYDLTVKQHASELIELDNELGRRMPSDSFSEASSRVGRSQLKRLRPLKDCRLIQKYNRALADGRAHAWHTLVYGMSLATYSLPLMQGLQNYCQQTLNAFALAGAARLELSEETLQAATQPALQAIPSMLRDAISRYSSR